MEHNNDIMDDVLTAEDHSMIGIINKLTPSCCAQRDMLENIYNKYFPSNRANNNNNVAAAPAVGVARNRTTPTISVALANVYRHVSRHVPAAYEIKETPPTGLPAGLHEPMRQALVQSRAALLLLRYGVMSVDARAATKRLLENPAAADDMLLDACFKNIVAAVARKRAMDRRRFRAPEEEADAAPAEDKDEAHRAKTARRH